MANNSFLQDIAQINNERRARERVEQLQEIERQWQETGRECYEAWQRGDRETCELLGADLERLKGDCDYLNPPQPPQIDQRLVDFARKNNQFFERYGQRAYQALDAAHAYMMRPRNPNTNNPAHTGMGWHPQWAFTPQYFEKLKDLMELHGENLLGIKYDRNEEALTPNEAAKVSGLSPQQYNNALRQVAAQGRLGTDRK